MDCRWREGRTWRSIWRLPARGPWRLGSWEETAGTGQPRQQQRSQPSVWFWWSLSIALMGQLEEEGKNSQGSCQMTTSSRSESNLAPVLSRPTSLPAWSGLLPTTGKQWSLVWLRLWSRATGPSMISSLLNRSSWRIRRGKKKKKPSSNPSCWKTRGCRCRLAGRLMLEGCSNEGAHLGVYKQAAKVMQDNVKDRHFSPLLWLLWWRMEGWLEEWVRCLDQRWEDWTRCQEQ